MLYSKGKGKSKGFTIIEMVISIFAFMTAFLIAKYGSFNQSVLLTNLAYDIALTLRNAQSYGLNVKSKPTSTENYSESFNYAYGVHFDSSSTENKKMIFFADIDNDTLYDSGEEILPIYNLKRGFYISNICIGHPQYFCQYSGIVKIDITFKRPNPNAIIKDNVVATLYKYADITIKSSTDSTASKKIKITDLGQISVIK